MFYPRLSRKQEAEYHSNRGQFYADYRENLENVTDDCKHRCVYCDVKTDEIGGEGMHLDHFRPQRYFPELSIHPFNLVLSCPKCNYLKSDDWPAEIAPDGPSFVNGVGYIDAFNDDPSNYLSVSEDGELQAIDGPAGYLIQRLQLNRLSRTQIRRRRLLSEKKRALSAEITNRLKLIRDNIQCGCSREKALEDLDTVIALKENIDGMEI